MAEATPAQVTQAGWLFVEIANAADLADRICSIDGGEDHKATLADMLRESICRIGWLADLGAEKIGQCATRDAGDGADVAQWLLCPAYHRAADRGRTLDDPAP